jgi:hypothetical protein
MRSFKLLTLLSVCLLDLSMSAGAAPVQDPSPMPIEGFPVLQAPAGFGAGLNSTLNGSYAYGLAPGTQTLPNTDYIYWSSPFYPYPSGTGITELPQSRLLNPYIQTTPQTDVPTTPNYEGGTATIYSKPLPGAIPNVQNINGSTPFTCNPNPYQPYPNNPDYRIPSFLHQHQ